jgi:hypothetical protein
LTPGEYFEAKGTVTSSLKVDNMEQIWFRGSKYPGDVLFQRLSEQYAVVVTAL